MRVLDLGKAGANFLSRGEFVAVAFLDDAVEENSTPRVPADLAFDRRIKPTTQTHGCQQNFTGFNSLFCKDMK